MAKQAEQELTVVEHLDELRRLIIISLVAVVVSAIGLYFVSDYVLAVLLAPVTSLGHQLHMVHITEALMTKLKLSLFLGFVAALPVILWQVWSFVMPALKREERKYFTIFVSISYVAFIAGLAFAFFVIFRLGVIFLLRFAGPYLTPMLTIGNYVSFTIVFLMPFGLMFQLPLAALFLAKLGVISHQFMKHSRKYALLVIVIVASMLTPADIVTNLLMTIPVYSLFELSVWIVGLVERRKARARAAAESEETST